MNCHFPKLFSPLRVGPAVLKNRIETGPMSIVELDAKGGLTDQAIAFYENLAAGGAAVVTLGESIIASANGMTHAQQLRFDNPAVPYSLQRAADAVHAHDALISIEISHGGCMADPAYNNGAQAMGPSAFVDQWGDAIREMTPEDMEQAADAFADAVELCRDCAFDLVMIHCGHGWLLSQFLSPAYNKRTDQYGGCLENRARFPLLVLDRVRQRVGRTIALEMRISGCEFIEGGISLEDVVAFCRLCEDKVDLINLSAGAPWTRRMAISVFEERGVNAEFSAAVKRAVTRIPVSSVGGYTDPALMERFLEEGRCDAFVLGRSILADPELPTKARTGREAEIHQCLRCFVCNNAQYVDRGRVLCCSINPMAGREAALRTLPPPRHRRKVVVAGGGPGGMTAALTAARRGHQVVLYEKSGALGGWLKGEAHIPFKRDMWRYIQSLSAELAREPGAKVLLNRPVTRELLEAEGPDTVICAIGSEPLRPPIPGLSLPHVMPAEAMYAPQPPAGKRVVVIGGGLVGCETALHLAWTGRQVTVVELRDRAAADAPLDYRRFLMEQLEPRVELACGWTVEEVAPEGVRAVDAREERRLFPGDTVVVAAGFRARSGEVEALRSPEYDLVVIGDCRRPRRVYHAVREGFDAALFLR